MGPPGSQLRWTKSVPGLWLQRVVSIASPFQCRCIWAPKPPHSLMHACVGDICTPNQEAPGRCVCTRPGDNEDPLGLIDSSCLLKDTLFSLVQGQRMQRQFHNLWSPGQSCLPLSNRRAVSSWFQPEAQKEGTVRDSRPRGQSSVCLVSLKT